MKRSVKERLAALQGFVRDGQFEMTAFILEDGTEFHTPLGPEEYLYSHGARSPDGRRIARYPHPEGPGVDELSASFFRLIDEAIAAGRLELSTEN